MTSEFRKILVRLTRVVALLAIFGLATTHLLAQSIVSGDITGTVTDPTGAVIAKAAVTLKSLDRGETQVTNTNESGFYRFSLLKPGRYAVSISHGGFRGEQRSVDVNVGQSTSANFVLQMGQATEVLEVTAEAPLVNSDSANVSTSYDLRSVSDVPNPGADLTNIAQLAPGVTMNTSGGYGNFTANGLPATANLFTVNGENNMDPFFNINNSGATNLTLGQNEIQEATVITNAYSAQYGQQAGAQVNYVTKSGTNAFHGDAKYYWNGRVMNANDWFANNQGSDRPFSNNNQWGADFGGPIIKNKLFFYVNNEGLRYVLPTVQNTYIPSPELSSAVLANVAENQPNSLPLYTQLLNVWTNPTSPGAQNAVPMANTCDDILNYDESGNPISSNLQGIDVNTPCIYSFSATPTQLSTEWILNARIDQNIGNNDKLFYRFRMDRGDQATYTDPINSAFNATSNQPSYGGQMQWTHVFNGTMTNQFIGAATWYSAKFIQDENNAVSTFPYGVQWLSTTFATMNNGNGYFGRQWSFPQGRNITQYQFIDDFVKVYGNHTLKLGASFRRYDVSDYNFFYKHPRLYFLSMLDFADGYSYRFRQWFSDNSAVPIAMYGLGWYGQDEWRVTPKLKLTLGLRMEHNSNPVCQTNCFSQFAGPWESLNHGTTVAYNQNIQTGVHQAFRGTDAVNFSPRIGFTWSPIDDKTVISGGIGIFYDAMAQGIMEPAFQSAPGVVDQSVYGELWADPTTDGAPAIAALSANALKNGFASGATYDSLRADTGNIFRAPTFTNFAGTMHTPEYQEWNLQVQRALNNNMSLSVNYFGTHGIYIPYNNGTMNAYSRVLCSDVDGNAVNCGAGFPSAPPDRSYATINQWRTGAVSNTNGLTTSLTQRFTHGLSFQANYTWSHGLDEVSNGGGFVYGSDSLGGQLNPAGLRINNYGNSDYDIRHNFSGNFVWEPGFKSNNKTANGAIGGWTISGAIFARTGLPYTVMDTNSVFTNLGGSVYVPGQLVNASGKYAGGSCSNGNSQCFDPAAFVDAAALPSGATDAYSAYPSQMRNQFRGPSFFDVNMNVMKNFSITERVKLGVGANFYNILNHPNFYLPNLYLSSGDPTVGKIQQTVATPASPYGSFVGAAASPRLIQLTGKISF